MALTLKPENIVQLVFFVRGEKVMFDADLAKLYGVSTKALNQAFRRNKQRFPSDFAFQLSTAEYDNLKSQIVTSSAGDQLEVTNCDLKFPRRPTPTALRVHRAGRRYAVERSPQRSCCSGQHRNHAHVRAAPPTYGYESRSRS